MRGDSIRRLIGLHPELTCAALLLEKCAEVGSRHICLTYSLNADKDILALVLEENIASLTENLDAHGWVLDGNYPDSHFQSWRKFHATMPSYSTNLIVVRDSAIYEVFVIAAATCKSLGGLDKAQRVALHEEFTNFSITDRIMQYK